METMKVSLKPTTRSLAAGNALFRSSAFCWSEAGAGMMTNGDNDDQMMTNSEWF
jgi:hypothetical protein